MHRKEGRSTPAEFMIRPTVTWADVNVDDEAIQILTETTGRALEGDLVLFLGENRRQRRLAAEAMANAQDKSLLRIDLGAVDSAWINETEANMNRVFDAAEKADALLLFDEADALFGRRTEVTDAHDRYGTGDVSRLLARLDAYRGVCILAASHKQSLDQAFIRRARACVDFPNP